MRYLFCISISTLLLALPTGFAAAIAPRASPLPPGCTISCPLLTIGTNYPTVWSGVFFGVLSCEMGPQGEYVTECSYNEVSQVLHRGRRRRLNPAPVIRATAPGTTITLIPSMSALSSRLRPARLGNESLNQRHRAAKWSEGEISRPTRLTWLGSSGNP